MKPVISVVIPAYNEEKLITACLQAVKHQTLPRTEYEILVIDNNSTDRTAELARAAGATVISYTEKQGFACTKNFGGKHAQGEIIAFTDADSQPQKDWLETIQKLMENPQRMLLGGTILSNENNVWIDFLFYLYDIVARVNQFLGIPLIWGPNTAMRKSAFDEIGGFNSDLKTSEDWEYTMRMQKRFGGKSCLYTPLLRVRTSPRKQENIFMLLQYSFIGVLNYCSIFLLRRSRTYGSPKHIR
ncbi:hypothetical protein BH11PAT1_BH11PAT1_1450 [soil metagenome]